MDRKDFYTPIISDELRNSLASAMERMQIQSPAAEAIQSAWSAYADAFTGYEQLFQSISAFSDNTMEIMLDGTDFSKEEVFEDIEEFQQANSDELYEE